MRKRRRETSNLWQVLAAHEQAGDVARDHHFHDGAVQHYQDALAVRDISEADRSRLSEKLAYALFYGEKPLDAIPWLERALPRHLGNTAESAKAVEMLLQTARQLWLDLKLEESLLVIERAIRTADAAANPRLRKLTRLRMLTHLRILGRYVDAEALLQAVDVITAEDDAVVRSGYFMEKAILAAVQGNALQAYEDFEKAVQAAKESEDAYYLTAVWTNYATWAVNLGNIELGKTCQERALLVARQNQILWRIAGFCLSYADILAKLGQYGTAYEFLLEALSYDIQAPENDHMLAEVGIPLALHMKDEATLLKCARASAITQVFHSGEPFGIGPVAAAFAAMYAMQGRIRKARILLHRALEKVNNVDGIWDLPLEVARHGELADIPRARALLESRAHLPSSAVADAFLKLFDAFVAQRNGRVVHMHEEATAAIELFEGLHWYAYADVARSLLPIAARPVRAPAHYEQPFLNVQPAMTEREQQVAELVLRGLTNRAIAERLGIKERTVEAHMTSIMSQLGIRSRYQLVGALSETE